MVCKHDSMRAHKCPTLRTHALDDCDVVLGCVQLAIVAAGGVAVWMRLWRCPQEHAAPVGLDLLRAFAIIK